jgi:hypothetical protein
MYYLIIKVDGNRYLKFYKTRIDDIVLTEIDEVEQACMFNYEFSEKFFHAVSALCQDKHTVEILRVKG